MSWPPLLRDSSAAGRRHRSQRASGCKGFVRVIPLGALDCFDVVWSMARSTRERANSQYRLDRSIPMNRRPDRSATAIVVPLPDIGSMTRSRRKVQQLDQPLRDRFGKRCRMNGENVFASLADQPPCCLPPLLVIVGAQISQRKVSVELLLALEEDQHPFVITSPTWGGAST